MNPSIRHQALHFVRSIIDSNPIRFSEINLSLGLSIKIVITVEDQ